MLSVFLSKILQLQLYVQKFKVVLKVVHKIKCKVVVVYQ